MKEIRRRLYTKPVMLGMALLVGITLAVTLFVTTKSKAAPNSFPVFHGSDEFATAADGETFHDFGGSPVDAGFFGTGSLKYSELVQLEGVALGPGSDVDTIIERASDVYYAGGSTGIQMTALSLKASDPITVTYGNGNTEQWDVFVGLSQFKASTGVMTINYSTFDSTLKVWPRFTFIRIPDGLTKVLDTGSGNGLTVAAARTGRADKSAVAPAPVPEPVPVPTIAPAPCRIIVFDDIETHPNSAVSAAAAASACPPVTLSSVNQPWGPCAPGTFCITVPITEEERWARHRPRPKRPVVVIGIGE